MGNQRSGRSKRILEDVWYRVWGTVELKLKFQMQDFLFSNIKMHPPFPFFHYILSPFLFFILMFTHIFGGFLPIFWKIHFHKLQKTISIKTCLGLTFVNNLSFLWSKARQKSVRPHFLWGDHMGANQQIPYSFHCAATLEKHSSAQKLLPPWPNADQENNI